MDQNNQNNLNNPNNQNSFNQQGFQNTQNSLNPQNVQNNIEPPQVQDFYAGYQPVENIPAPGAEAEPATKAEKKKKNPLFVAIIAVIIVAIFAVGGYFVYNNYIKDSNNDKVEITNSTLKEKDASEISTIELYPDRAVTKNDLKDFAEVIDERAKLLGDAYQIDVDDSKITLIIEKDLLGSTSAERSVTVEMLTSRGNVALGTEYYVDNSSNVKEMISSAEIFETGAQSILSKYARNMPEDKYEQLSTVSEKTIYGLEITLNSQGVEEVGTYIGEDTSSSIVTLKHDFEAEAYDENPRYFGSVLAKSNDGKTAYVICQMPTYKKTAELMKVILNQDTMSFGLVKSIADEPNWQTDDVAMGQNQVKSMDSDSIIAQFTPDEFSRLYNSEADFAKYESIVKSRLDILGFEYMFGTTGFDDKTYCVKLSPSDVAPDFFRLIFGPGNVEVYSAFDTVFGLYDPEVVEENGTYAIRMYSFSSPQELLEQNNIPNNIVYLVANDVTIASADVSAMTEGEDGYNYLYFTDFLCFGDIEVSQSEANILNLICYINENEYISMEGTFHFRTNTDIESLDSFDWKYEPLTSEDKRVFDIVTSLGYDIEKLVDSRNMLVITIDMPINESLPENFLNAVKEIYTACNFDTGAYNKINFVIKDESIDSPADKFRIEVEKDTYDGKMEIDDEVYGPKFYDYWSPVYNLMDEDPFFTERSYY